MSSLSKLIQANNFKFISFYVSGMQPTYQSRYLESYQNTFEIEQTLFKFKNKLYFGSKLTTFRSNITFKSILCIGSSLLLILCLYVILP